MPSLAFAVLHRSLQLRFIIFIGLLGPQKKRHSVFDKRSRYSNFNEPPEEMRRRPCLPTGAALCAGTKY